MDNKSRSSSNISLDSLEIEYKRESLKQKSFEENVDTILVPLYEKDVLIKVPKRKKKQSHCDDKCKKKNSKNTEDNELTNYLVNKDSRKIKKTSYLEMFRKQFTSNVTDIHNKRTNNEIRSISPEFGDTEIETLESFGNESSNKVNDFYNTESYNDVYYDKLMKKELQQYLEHSFEDVLHFDEDIPKFLDDINDNNLRSISEVSQPRRRLKSKMTSPIHNVRLGGLGPDMEKIKPRLERARSLQRYSEKVRMENRLKIYKKEIQNEKSERETSATRRDAIMNHYQKDNRNSSSYLVNKSIQEKTSLIKKICHTKSKSADVQKLREREEKQILAKNDIINYTEKNKKGKALKPNKDIEIERKDQKKKTSTKDQYVKDATGDCSLSLKSSSKVRKPNTESKKNDEVSPLQISFMVNVGGVRPSTALKSLEEKHRMYQEKVKQFSTDINNI